MPLRCQPLPTPLCPWWTLCRQSSPPACFAGSGYADFGFNASSVTFKVTASVGGQATLTFRYANGSTANRPLNVTVNGVVIATPTFASTVSWTTWNTLTLHLNLVSGNNTIKLTVTGTGTDGPNLDFLTVG